MNVVPMFSGIIRYLSGMRPPPFTTSMACPGTDDGRTPPLVVVEGFLGGAGPLLGTVFEEFLNWDHQVSTTRRRSMIFASVGPVSSLHDRACELYFALKGGTVDYGEDHSNFHRHLRFGRTHSKGLYPQWSLERPLHFLGHSMGGPTIVKLQSLLKQGHFGPNAHPDMILSINSVASPFRGTQIVYSLGESKQFAPAIRRISVGSVVAKGVHCLAYLSPFLPSILDFHVECRRFSFHESSFWDFCRHFWKSEWAEGKDAMPFDATFESAEEREHNKEEELNPNTFYRSHTSCMTHRAGDKDNTHLPPISTIVTPLYFTSRWVGAFDFSALRPVPSFLSPSNDDSQQELELSSTKIVELGEEYWANDGFVPLFSQWHPLPCSSTRCQHYTSCKAPPARPEPGRWHVHQLEDVDHISFWKPTVSQRAFWGDLADWLRAIDRLTEDEAFPVQEDGWSKNDL